MSAECVYMCVCLQNLLREMTIKKKHLLKLATLITASIKTLTEREFIFNDIDSVSAYYYRWVC